METKYFSLSSVENNRLVKIIQIIFGIVCIFVAIFWLIFNIRSMKSNGTLWITIIFLTGFGFYQIWSGAGKAARFIEIGSDRIRLKRTVFLPALEMPSKDLQKIEVYPFNLIFFLKEKKKIVLRFSTTYVETNEKVKDEILSFAELNKINIEFVEEKI
jgi:energy-coupling factor transporter transmembrane protein EcfT